MPLDQPSTDVRASPFNLVGRLGDEEALRVGLQLDVSRVDGDLAVGAVIAARLDRQQQQLQLGEAEPGAAPGHHVICCT